MIGAVWAIGAAMVFSMGHIAVRKGVGTVGVVYGTAMMLVVGTLTVAVAALILDDLAVLAAATWTGVLYFAGAGVIHFVGGWGFMNTSIRYVGAARMAAITGVTPLISAVLAILTLHEQLNPYLAAGATLIVLGTVFIATE